MVSEVLIGDGLSFNLLCQRIINVLSKRLQLMSVDAKNGMLLKKREGGRRRMCP